MYKYLQWLKKYYVKSLQGAGEGVGAVENKSSLFQEWVFDLQIGNRKKKTKLKSFISIVNRLKKGFFSGKNFAFKNSGALKFWLLLVKYTYTWIRVGSILLVFIRQ